MTPARLIDIRPPVSAPPDSSALAAADRFLREVQAREHAAELRHSETVEALGFGVAVLDAQGIVESLNRTGAQLLRIPVDQVVGRALLSMPWRILAGDGSSLSREAHPALVALRTGERRDDVPLGLVREGGDATWLEVSATPLFREGSAVPYAVVTSFRDVTRRRHAEAALIASEARFRAVTESLEVGLVLTDLNDRALYVNRRMSEMTGYPRASLLGAELGSMLLPPDQTTEFSRRTSARMRGDAETYEVEHVRADGSRFFAEISGAPYRDVNGVVIGTVGTVTDVSDRKAVEVMKAQLVGVVSHELRTPLGAVATALAILTRSLGELEPRPAQMLELATRNTTRLLGLVDRLLDVERLESGVVPLDLARCEASALMEGVRDLLQPVADAAGARIVVEPTTAIALADPDRLTQCLTNLVGNAIKFSPAEGAVTLGARVVDGEVRFSVRDEGCGIPPAHVAGLFNRFVQVDSDGERRRKGAGLGLVISRAIVEQHHGRIWVESEEAKGSTFFFTVSAASEAGVPG